MTIETATELVWHALIVGVLIGAWLTATLTSLYLYLRRRRERRLT